MTIKRRNTLQFIFAWILVLIGIVLIFLSFFVPPVGDISPTVLTAFGEILTFAGAVIGIDYSYKKKIIGRQTEENEDK